MSYVLDIISGSTVKGIKDSWFSQLELIEDSDYLVSGIERMVDWCEKVLDDNETHLWEIREEGNDTPRAIVEIADARKSKDPSYKFLNIYLEPNLILDYKDEIRKEDIAEIIDILAFAMSASLELANENGTHKLKIHGKTKEMHNLFDSLIMNASNENLGITLYRQSSWLIIETLDR